MSETITGAIIGVGGAIVGALIAALVGYYFSINLMRRQEFNKAAAIFRSAFTDEIRKLKKWLLYNESTSEETVLGLLNNADVKIENAYRLFRPYLTESKRVSLDNAWKEYCHPQGGDPKQMPGRYYEYFIDMSLEHSITLIIKKIEQLLKLAKP